ncbi:MAG TPA: M20/M25/M40 family metallo-hydrolase [Casimicrobiaceae bacterium]|nr:M20/M25/M40 family metallo-hydrolase [Casimicrobiaceae bacterium]
MSGAPLPPVSRLVVAIALVALVLVATFAASRGPTALPESAPPDVYSVGRARGVLQRLAGDSIPHPIGSSQHAIVRDRVIAEFRALGYSPELESDLSCAPTGSCALVQNIVATLPGSEPGPAVILNAHYDSVPAGPGAGDDAAGVATLIEVARAMRTLPTPRFPVVFLADDGEEVGLLGAEAFVRRHKAADYASVLVLEARGSSGRTLMFETSQDNRAVVDAYARAVPRPSTSSVYFSVYQRLPNGTNFTVFKHAGIRGMAAAFIGDPAQYHTPQNCVDNVPDRTLQHMGDTALGVTREIAVNGLAEATGNASYFDVLTLAVLRWPEVLNAPIAVTVFLLLCALAVLQRRASRVTVRELAWALGVGLLPMILAGLAGFAVSRIVASRLEYAAWPASEHWIVLAAWASGFAAVALCGTLGRGRIRSAAAWTGVWIDLSLLGIGAAFLLPGAAYLFAGPAAIAALTGSASWIRRNTADSPPAVIVPLVTISLLIFPFALELVEGMGSGTLFGVAILVAAASAPLLPLLVLSRWSLKLAGTSMAVALAAAGAVFVVPVFTADAPRPLTFVYQMDRGEARARWLVEMPGEVAPEPLHGVAVWRKVAIPSLAIGRDDAPATRTAADAAPTSLAFPEARIAAVEPRGKRSLLRVELHSPRGAVVMRLRFGMEFDPRLVSVGEFVVGGASPATGTIVVHTVPPEGIVVGVEIGSDAGGSEFAVDDETPGLPAEGAPLLHARGADSVPIHRGDRTMLSTIGRVPALRPEP